MPASNAVEGELANRITQLDRDLRAARRPKLSEELELNRSGARARVGYGHEENDTTSAATRCPAARSKCPIAATSELVQRAAGETGTEWAIESFRAARCQPDPDIARPLASLE